MGGSVSKQKLQAEEQNLLGKDSSSSSSSFYWGATVGWMAYVGTTHSNDLDEDEMDRFRRRRRFGSNEETVPVEKENDKVSQEKTIQTRESFERNTMTQDLSEHLTEEQSDDFAEEETLFEEEKRLKEEEELLLREEELRRQEEARILEEEERLKREEEEIKRREQEEEARRLEEEQRRKQQEEEERRKLEEEERKRQEEEERRRQEEEERKRQEEERRRLEEEEEERKRQEEEALKELTRKEEENQQLKKQVEEMQRKLEEETKLRLEQKQKFTEEMEENRAKVEALKSLKESASQLMHTQFEALQNQTEVALTFLNNSRKKLELLITNLDNQMHASQKVQENLQQFKEQLISDVSLKAKFEKANEKMDQDLSSLEDGINQLVKSREVFDNWQKQLYESKSKFDEEIADLQDVGSKNLHEVIEQMEKSKQEVEDEIAQLDKRIEISDARKKELEEMKVRCTTELNRCREVMNQLDISETQENLQMLQTLVNEVSATITELESYKQLVNANLSEVDTSLKNTKDLQNEIYLQKSQHEAECLSGLEENFQNDVDNIKTSFSEEIDQILSNQHQYVTQQVEEIKKNYQPVHDAKKIQDFTEQSKQVQERLEEIAKGEKKTQEILQKSQDFIQRESAILNNLQETHGKVKDDIENISKMLEEESKEREEFTNSKRTGIQYQAKKGDQVDKLVSEFLNSITGFDENLIPPNFERISEGVYQFGTRRIRAQILNGSLVVRVGGGFMTFPEFVKKYGKSESVKIIKAPGGPRTTTLIRKGMNLSLAKLSNDLSESKEKLPRTTSKSKIAKSPSKASFPKKAVSRNTRSTSSVQSPTDKPQIVRKTISQPVHHEKNLKKSASKEKTSQ